MIVDPRSAVLFIPPGLKGFKQKLFDRIGEKVGRVVRGDYAELAALPDDLVPVTGCSPALRPLYADWKERGRPFVYWDRGYLRRVFATWLPTGDAGGFPGGFYRWHYKAFQMAAIADVPDDRWRTLKIEDEVKPWRKGGGKIVIADTLPDYWNVRGLPVDWSLQMAARLRKTTKRSIVVRHKESKRPLADELREAHCLVAHGSIAAVEAVVMGCPVFVDTESAAALVGKTDFEDIENPVYPERQAWLNSLAYNQFNEAELVDGTLWRLLS